MMRIDTPHLQNLIFSDYNYTTLETVISLDGNEKTGDRGKTEIAIYADEHLLHKETFTNTTPSQKLTLAIPQGTKQLTFYAVMSIGNDGCHIAVFGYPRLTNSLDAVEKETVLSLYDLKVVDQSNQHDLYDNGWTDKPFEISNGNLAVKAIALSPRFKEEPWTYVKYDVHDYNYSTLNTTISLENTWKIGDHGKTQVEIFADNVKVYSKTFTDNTPVQSVKIPLPKDTHTITFYAIFEKGDHGDVHGIIFDDPTLTNELSFLPKDYSTSLTDLIAVKNSFFDIYKNRWEYLPFQLSDGSLAARGFGFKPNIDFYSETFATFYIGNFDYTSMETAFSFENKWPTSNQAYTTIEVFADHKRIYETSINNNSKIENVILSIPTGTEHLKVSTRSNSGSRNHGVIMENPQLTYRPWKPSVNTVLTNSTEVKGKTSPIAEVFISKESTVLGKGSANFFGEFTVKIPAQKRNTTLKVTAKDKRSSLTSETNTIVKGITQALKKSQIKVVNHTGKSDKVTVSGLKKNEVVKIYNSKGKLIASKTAKKGTETITIKQLGKKKGKIQLSLTKPDQVENKKITVNYKGEKSKKLKASQVNE